ncbi:hypothetical protein [uncultured Desulfovibrio sp.]|uniref:glycine-rich domain-containing protein n=1 Tax=uncultured Desulfovibrio sp. TaxID=167968 RepID=UPI00262DF413|nr:hypothetical protein [uncultured Desulfovibrio sp.]
MTMPSSVSRARYEGNGTATRFPFSFKVWETSQLSVTLTRPDGISSAAEGWTASLDEDGGTVTYLHEGSPLPEGWLLAITRDMPFTQEIDLVSATRFDPAVMEDGLDMATAERQQLREQLSRSVILPPTSDKSPLEMVNRLLEAEKNAVNAAQKAETEADTATEQAGRAEAEADEATRQADAAADSALLARAWAESPTPPDPDDPASKSAKEWARIASDTVPLATASLPGKACFPAPFTIGQNGAVGIRGATAQQNGICRLATAAEIAAATAPATVALPGNALSLTAQAGKIPVYGAGGKLPVPSLPSVICNTRLVLAASNASWASPVSGWARITVIGGGGGGCKGHSDGTSVMGGGGGASGECRIDFRYLQKGTKYPVTVGAGGAIGEYSAGGTAGGASAFNGITAGGGKPALGSEGGAGTTYSFPGTRGGYNSFSSPYEALSSGGTGGGFGYGRGGNGANCYKNSGSANNASKGAAGAVIIEYYNPSKGA